MSKEPSIKDMLVPSMGRAFKHIHILGSKRLANTGLTLKQFILLEHVRDKSLPQCDLAIITDRDKGSLTRLIQSLERKKFVKRTVAEHDKRVNLVEATAAGRSVLKAAYPIMMDMFEELTRGIGPQELNAVKAIMTTLMSRAIALTGEVNCNNT
jgi:DNA-binding MarR family transcriptional regulator